MLAHVLRDPVHRVVGGDVERQRRPADFGGGLRRGPRLRPLHVDGSRWRRHGRTPRRWSRRYRAPHRSPPRSCRRAGVPVLGRGRRPRRPGTPGRRRRRTSPTAGTAASTRVRSRPASRRPTDTPAFTVAPRAVSLPSERVNPSSARCAMRSSTLPVSSGVVPTTTIATRGPEVAQQRSEELVQPLEPDGFGDAGGVVHQPAERVGPATAEVVGDHVVVLGQRGAQRLDDAALTADQQRACQGRITGPVAAQRLGLRHAELLGEERSGRRVDDLRVQIGSHGDELTPE